jgi:hydroxymethylpyrimidine pyrophosphatase-like HAD family hydrolase
MPQLQIKFLIALDLDGTSVTYSPRLAMDDDLMRYLAAVQNMGIVWVMNSDRFTDTMADIASLLPAEQKPLALLSCQRFIHLRQNDDAYLPVHEWNAEQIHCHMLLWNKISPFFPQWSLEVESQFEILDCVVNDLVFAYRVTPEQTPALRCLMQHFISDWPDAQISGNKEWTFILHVSFSKAKVLKKCVELLGVESDQVIAIGDGMNDITMLDGSVTNFVGCPANSSSEVIKTVINAGGIVSRAHEAAGTIDIIQRFLDKLL